MKKVLLSLLVFSFLVTGSAYAETNYQLKNNEKSSVTKPNKQEMQKRRESFEKRLNLTEEQVKLAKTQRENTREKMYPLMLQLKQKYSELSLLPKENLIEELKIEKEKNIKKDIKDLEKQIHELKVQNMRDFESILTAKQRKELIRMKQEGRKNFAKHHRPKPPFGAKLHNIPCEKK